MAGEPVAGDLVVIEDLEICFERGPERLTLVGSDDMVVRQAESSKGC